MNSNSRQRRVLVVNNFRNSITMTGFALWTVCFWACRYAAANKSEALNDVHRGADMTDRRILAGGLDASTAASLNSARSAALRTLNLIYQRYEFSTPRIQFLLVSANMPNSAWNIMKYKTATKFVNQKSTFKFIFGGSSVTAGHDNFFNESYPSIFENRVGSVLKSLGINLEVHNIAHGTNKCRPSDLCYEAMGGENADWIGWEQSFDCGRDRGVFELMARTAFWNRAVVFYSASGGFVPGHCPPSNVNHHFKST
jgi:hypothetical protein